MTNIIKVAVGLVSFAIVGVSIKKYGDEKYQQGFTEGKAIGYDKGVSETVNSLDDLDKIAEELKEKGYSVR